MVRYFQAILLSGAMSILAACGTGDAGADAATAPDQKGFQMKSGEMFDDDSDKMIGRYAKTNPAMQKGEAGPADESSVGGNTFFQGEFAKRDFAAKDYSKKAFWGSKGYAAKVYGGTTDGNHLRKGARANFAPGASEGGLASSASGSHFETSRRTSRAAREGGSSGFSKRSDSVTDSRRKSYEQPQITDWRNQRGLTIDDTKSMLGRSN